MRVHVGTSGFSYKEWKGSFYPENMAASGMLAFYAARFATVEINNTFYRMPRPELLSSWAEQVPAGFTFGLKAAQRITHRARLGNDAHELVEQFVRVARGLGSRLGPILFQLPPFFKKDVAVLRGFLERLPRDVRAAFEFRNASWADDEVHAALREHAAALCLSESDEKETPRFVTTSPWGYLRLRRAEYDAGALQDWARRIAESGWTDAYVYFKHEDEARGPIFATGFEDAARAAGLQVQKPS